MATSAGPEERGPLERALFSSLPVAAWLCDPADGRIFDANEEACARYGFSKEEFVGRSLADLHAGPDPRPGRDLIRYEGIRQLSTKAGESRDVRVIARAVPVGDRRALLLIAIDVTLERRIERALHESQRRYRALVQGSSDIVTILEPDTTLTYVSPSIERVLGHDPRALVGSRLADLVHPQDVGSFVAGISEALSGPHEPHSALESRWRHRDGTWRHVESLRSNLLDDPDVGGILLTTRDVTERKALEEQLTSRVLHDPLTGLANRALFRDRVDRALDRARRHARAVALMLVDIDHFKGVNETFGNATGDALLALIADRIADVCRPGDTVARLAGDEFGVVLDETTATEAMELAGRLARELAAPLRTGDSEVLLTASIAVAAADGSGSSDELMRHSDIALYTAKTSGGARIESFRPSMTRAAEHRVEIGTSLHRAIERDELFIQYQPIYALGNGRISGFEALIRWRHPSRGVVPPAEFISVAEQTGLIVPIGRRVLLDGCRTVRSWRDRFGSDLRLHVNVSARQLQDASIVDDVADAIMISGLRSSALTLEITESILMHDVGAAVARLSALRELGVKVAIDDFGTGYSSLSYLRHLPVDSLKIDKAFIDQIDGSVEDSSLARAVIRLGKTMHLEAVAEGIERRSQLDALRQAGCPYGQGFLLEPPLDVASADEVLVRDSDAVRRGALGFANFFSR